MGPARANEPVQEAYGRLLDAFGPQGWWPARTRMEMIVGAILTQHTAWTNVERAIAELRASGLLTPEALATMPEAALARHIRAAGTYRIKAKRIKAFIDYLDTAHGCRLDRLFRLPTDRLRKELLAVPGIGPETADCILLYAGRRPVFVVDAYTRRILVRHDWLRPGSSYDVTAQTCAGAFSGLNNRERAHVFGEFHALIVETGKRFCRSRPRCEECPLAGLLPRGGPRDG